MTLQIGSLRADAGEKTSGYLQVDVGMAAVRLPIVLINGAQPGPRLTLTAGIHHGEFIGIEGLLAFLRQLNATSLHGQIVACPLANPPSFFSARGSLSPLDEINPNRIFPGNKQGKPTERLASWLFENLMASADAYIDLHGGGLSEEMVPLAAYRSSGDPSLDSRSLALAEAFGLPDIVRGPSAEGGNTHAAATRAGIPSVLIEIGSLGSRAASEIQMVEDGLLCTLRHLGMMEGSSPTTDIHVQHWCWADVAVAPTEGLWYPEFNIGAEVTEGDRLGRILDPLGNELVIVRSPATGKAFYGHRALSVSARTELAAIGELERN